MARGKLNNALVAGLRGNLSELTELMRSEPELFGSATLVQVANILDGKLWVDGSGRPKFDHDLIAQRLWWLVLVEGLSKTAADRWIAATEWPDEKGVSESAVKKLRLGPVGKRVEREIELKLNLYDKAELRSYQARLALLSEWPVCLWPRV